MKEKLFLSSPDCDREHINKDFFLPPPDFELVLRQIVCDSKAQVFI